jgi:hypothetical protein
MKKLLIILFLLPTILSNAQEAFFRGNNSYIAPQFQAPPITSGEVTNGLLLYLNAGNTSSYSGTGITWNDLSGNNSGSLPVFQNGSFAFNGSTSYVSIVSSVIPNTGSWTLSTWAKMPGGRFTEMINTRDASTLTGQGNFVIGWDYAWGGGAEYFLGNVATVSVYNYVLSSSDVTTNFNAVRTRFGL